MTRRRAVLRRFVRRLPTPGELRGFARALRGRTRVSTVRAAVDGLVVTRTLRRHGVRPLVAGLRGDRSVNDADRARQVAEAVDAGLAVLPVAATCLRRSLTLARELERLDLAGTVHVGVRGVDGAIEAHAWIQVGPEVVNDRPELIATYTELAGGELERLAPLVR